MNYIKLNPFINRIWRGRLRCYQLFGRCFENTIKLFNTNYVHLEHYYELMTKMVSLYKRMHEILYKIISIETKLSGENICKKIHLAITHSF